MPSNGKRRALSGPRRDPHFSRILASPGTKAAGIPGAVYRTRTNPPSPGIYFQLWEPQPTGTEGKPLKSYLLEDFHFGAIGWQAAQMLCRVNP